MASVPGTLHDVNSIQCQKCTKELAGLPETEQWGCTYCDADFCRDCVAATGKPLYQLKNQMQGRYEEPTAEWVCEDCVNIFFPRYKP